VSVLPALSLFLCFILIYVPRMVVARYQAQQPEGLDNAHPRAQQAKLTGVGARANAAHMNAFEAFAPFAAAVLLCELRRVDPSTVGMLAMTFVGLRAVYTLLYIANVPTLRSLVWIVGFGVTATLYVYAIRA
jgi:uncharacterized MAPEG superfamily protein